MLKSKKCLKIQTFFLPYYSNIRLIYNQNSYQSNHNSPQSQSLHENHSNADPSATIDLSRNDNALNSYSDNEGVF